MLGIRKEREKKESVIVVLEGVKASTDEKGVASLRWALREVVDAKDDLLVLTILNPGASLTLNDSEEDEYIMFLHHEISQTREAYLQILKPYYNTCKSGGVKFQAKVVAGFQPEEIVIQSANDAMATWIIMDRCFANILRLKLSGLDRKIVLVNDDEEAEVLSDIGEAKVPNHPSLSGGLDIICLALETQPNPNPPKVLKESVTQEEPHIRDSFPIFQGKDRPFPPSLLNMSRESENPVTAELPTRGTENPKKAKSPTKTTTQYDESVSLGKRVSEATVVLGLPLNLSLEEIVKITNGFCPGSFISKHEKKFDIYHGFMDQCGLHVMVKRFTGYFSDMVEAEKRVISSMFHQNIFRPIGYHESANTAALVYCYESKGTLKEYLYDAESRGKQVKLTFEARMKIAIHIAQGVRYMHEECPGGPIFHGDLQPWNIFLGHDFQPLISGFGRATGLKLKQVTTDHNRCSSKNCLDYDSTTLVKSDILAFGVLLLRLFCWRSLPKDDGHLIEWARPLLLGGAYHELLGQEMEDMDPYEVYRVMNVATKCISTNPLSRPGMIKVVSILKGENLCATQSSPSYDGSLQRGTKNISY